MIKQVLTKRIAAIMLTALLVPSAMSKPAQANPAVARAAIAACTAQPEACAVVFAGAGAWVLWRNAPKLWCTSGGCVHPRQPRQPRESRVGPDGDHVQGQHETHFVMSRQDCVKMFNRYKAEGLNSYEFIPSPQPGARKAGFCKLKGPGARNDRFHDHRYDSDY